MKSLKDETYARAVLSHFCDGADVFIHAILKACTAIELLELIALSTQKADKTIDELFMRGTALWGRTVNNKTFDNYRVSREKWKQNANFFPELFGDDAEKYLLCQPCDWIISPQDEEWPEQLNDLAIRSDWAPPLCLRGIGNKNIFKGCSSPLAVVGSREINEYGRSIAYNLAKNAAKAGHLVVSGGACGADAAAHWGAADACKASGGSGKIGRTVAVFAGGLSNMGPKSNDRLFSQIEECGGALISEHANGVVPLARRFLLRNRIIAALAGTVAVAQARYRSGALNTAGWAQEMNRIIVAAPGAINSPYNTGCNRLILEGKANLLFSQDDISDFCHPAHEFCCDSDCSSERDSSNISNDNSHIDSPDGKSCDKFCSNSEFENHADAKNARNAKQTAKETEIKSGKNLAKNTQDLICATPEEKGILKVAIELKKQNAPISADNIFAFIRSSNSSNSSSKKAKNNSSSKNEKAHKLKEPVAKINNIAQIAAILGRLESKNLISFNEKGAAQIIIKP